MTEQEEKKLNAATNSIQIRSALTHLPKILNIPDELKNKIEGELIHLLPLLKSQIKKHILQLSEKVSGKNGKKIYTLHHSKNGLVVTLWKDIKEFNISAEKEKTFVFNDIYERIDSYDDVYALISDIISGKLLLEI